MNITKILAGKTTLFLLSLSILLSSCSTLEGNRKRGPTLGPVVKKSLPKAKRKNINWKKEIIYFLLIDRFNDGDLSNNDPQNRSSYELFDPNKKNYNALKKYQGGDLKGVIAKLPYLKELGATTIWLSPHIDNANQDFMGWWPYHGYHSEDHYKVEDHFGDLKLLKKLVKKAHALGLKVILDIVYNHVGQNHPWVIDSKNWQERGFKHWFHPHSRKDDSTSIKNWADEEEVETKELFGLPDFDQSNPNVYKFLLDVSKYWIQETGCDGFRLDAVKHASPEFWTKLNQDLHNWAGEDFLLLGEVFTDNHNYVAKYQHLGFNSIFDFPLHYTIAQVFATGGTMDLLSEHLLENFKIYSSDLILGTFIDNHDVDRFALLAGDNYLQKLMLALTFINTIDGIPVIYYGTEVALLGGSAKPKNSEVANLLNRVSMPWEQVTKDKNPQGLIDKIKKLLKFRKEHKSLYDGDFLELYRDFSSYVYAKISDQDISIVAFNNSSKKVTIKFPVRYSFLKEGQVLENMLQNGQIKIIDGTISLKLKGYSADIYNSVNSNIFKLPSNYKIDINLTKKYPKGFVPVKFAVKVQQPDVVQVFLSGEFNGWKPRKDAMTYNNKTGLWEIQYPLKRGSYRYKFVINGDNWISDPKAQAVEDDGFGGKNSIMNVE